MGFQLWVCVLLNLILWGCAISITGVAVTQYNRAKPYFSHKITFKFVLQTFSQLHTVTVGKLEHTRTLRIQTQS